MTNKKKFDEDCGSPCGIPDDDDDEEWERNIELYRQKELEQKRKS